MTVGVSVWHADRVQGLSGFECVCIQTILHGRLTTLFYDLLGVNKDLPLLSGSYKVTALQPPPLTSWFTSVCVCVNMYVPTRGVMWTTLSREGVARSKWGENQTEREIK